MANKVNGSPSVPTPIALTSTQSISTFITSLVSSLVTELRDHAMRLNNGMMKDGTEAATAPVVLKTYAKASLPNVATFANGMIIVSDDVGGLTPAFSDGVNWRRTADRNVIS
jgi:hypothetical protein